MLQSELPSTSFGYDYPVFFVALNMNHNARGNVILDNELQLATPEAEGVICLAMFTDLDLAESHIEQIGAGEVFMVPGPASLRDVLNHAFQAGSGIRELVIDPCRKAQTWSMMKIQDVLAQVPTSH